MSWKRQISKLERLFRRQEGVEETGEEMPAHIEIEAWESGGGKSADDAYFAARRRFGNLTVGHE